jgi:polyhydroxyalkanoate synthesis regulator phasin
MSDKNALEELLDAVQLANDMADDTAYQSGIDAAREQYEDLKRQSELLEMADGYRKDLQDNNAEQASTIAALNQRVTELEAEKQAHQDSMKFQPDRPERES